MKRTRAVRMVSAAVVVVVAGCGAGASPRAEAITLYTCTSANVEQAVVHGFEAAHRGTEVTVFRAATGQLNARVAADVRSGGIRADVIWACDPLTMQGYDSQGLLRAWSPPNASEIPSAYRAPDYIGIDLLYMVVVVHQGIAAPTTWADLTAPVYRGKVALPSPTFAASALGLLGDLAAADGYGMGYYNELKGNGAIQVNAPADVLTGVEQGSYAAGATLANAAYADRLKGSPIDVVWPKPGGIAIYAPIGVTTKKQSSPVAEQFAAYAASRMGQTLMAEQDTYVTIPGLGGPPIPAGSPVVAPDWTSVSAHSQQILAAYAAIFGG